MKTGEMMSAQVISKVSKTVQVWYWPTLQKPFRVQTRLPRPGQPYRLHSAHDTQAEAEAEAAKIV
jgi:hypothetical protein